MPSLQVVTLVEGAYTLLAEGAAETPVTVAEVVALTVTPQDLIDG